VPIIISRTGFYCVAGAPCPPARTGAEAADAKLRNSVVMNRRASATLWPPAPTKPLEAMESLAGSRGTLLAIVPVNGGTSRLAIVSYLLPHPSHGDSPPRAEPATDALVVDSAQHRVLADGQDIGLVFQEFELLEFLTANPGSAFTRRQLLAQVWGDLRQATGRTVDVHIHRLRRKLGPVYGPRLVTVRRVGYMYDPPATRP
jgi:Transcriptional regulatory protein, C terminal